MHRRRRIRKLAGVLLLIGIAGPAFAQFDAGNSQLSSVYPDISIEAATHLRTAASYVSDRNWPEAIELYEKLIDVFGDKIVQVGSSPIYVTVRNYCHMQLAVMPPAARTLYRQRVDGQAEAWYRQAVRERDRELLARVVERTFVSSWGDNALDALAELVFEAGQFDHALMLWKRIDTRALRRDVPSDDDRQAMLTGMLYPDSDLPLASIEAKKILCLIFQGKSDAASRAIADFRTRFPRAHGTLGGVEGPWIERLTSIAREFAEAPSSEDALWVTFAGNAQRSKVLPQSVDIGSVQWTAQLPQAVQPRLAYGKSPVGASSSEEVLSYHPLVLRDLVLVAGREEVRAYDLHEGPKNGERPLWTFPLRDVLGQTSVVANRPSFGIPHFTMTADRGRLYVRLGAPETTVALRRGGQADSHLLCLDIAADGKEVWRIQPEPNEPDLAFEGSPVVAGGNVFIGVTRGGAMTHSYLACYDAASGAKKWRTLICESSASPQFLNPGVISHNLPTLGAGMVFYNTNRGAVAAMDQRTGQVRWIATYPRDRREELMANPRAVHYGREPSPCVYHEGTVLVMPTDGHGVCALDALTGELRWRTPEPPSFTHMLGVAHGNLICTGSQVMAIDVATGKRVWQWSDSASITSYGRGVLAGDHIYFPTKTHIFIIDQRTGVLAKPKVALQDSHHQSPGNLVIGEGYLVVAQAKSLTVFCQYDVLINRYRELIAQNPASADPHFRLARAAEASGSIELAVAHYRATIDLSSSGGTEEERAIRQVAKAQLYALLLQLGKTDAQAQRWSSAEEHYREAATIAPTIQGKLDALLHLAESWRTAEDATRSLAVFQEILEDEMLRGQGIAVEPNRTVRSDVEIASRVDALIERFGRDVYAAYERAAEQVFQEAAESGELPTLERLLRSYPNAQIVSQVLLYLGNAYSEDRQSAAASAAFRQLLSRHQTPRQERVAAMIGLAQLYEAQRSWPAARNWWQRLMQEFPDASMPMKPEQSVASFVADHLGQSPYEQAVAPLADRLQLPLARRWSRFWGEHSRVLIPAGSPPTEPGILVLVTNPASVECVAAETGEPIWSLKGTGPVRWAAFHDDNVLLGTDSQLFSVHATTGEQLWQQKTSTGLPGFSEFRLVEDRVYLREDSRRLCCIAAGSGATLWSFTPTEGTVLPNTFFSSQHIVLRTRQPGKFIVLDGDGRRRLEVAQSGESWDQMPAAIDSGRLCIATDARTVQLIDLNDGKQIWSYVAFNSDQKPVPIVAPGCLLVIVGGNTLIRLDSDTGKPMWSCRVSEDVLPRHGRAWTVDAQMFYCVTRELNLRAFRLSDGELEWEQFLTGPGDQWQVAASAGYVVALPRQPHTSEGLPMMICRQADGRLVQRLFFRPRGIEALVHLSAQYALIGSEREIWALGKEGSGFEVHGSDKGR